jgi:hypothetical protein
LKFLSLENLQKSEISDIIYIESERGNKSSRFKNKILCHLKTITKQWQEKRRKNYETHRKIPGRI